MPVPSNVLLQTIIPHAPDTRTLRLAWSLDFIPGQAVQVLLPGDEKKRYFSVSSSPTEQGHVDITVKSDPLAALSVVLNRLSEGASIEAAGPFGSFTLPARTDQPLCFIAAGSGITPFRSMVKFMIDQNRLPPCWVFHCARTTAGLLFHQEFAQWAKAHSQLRYRPTLTHNTDEDWAFETGRISETMIRKHIEGEAHCFLLCGPPVFVSDMEKLLLGMNVPAAHIRREQW